MGHIYGERRAWLISPVQSGYLYSKEMQIKFGPVDIIKETQQSVFVRGWVSTGLHAILYTEERGSGGGVGVGLW